MDWTSLRAHAMNNDLESIARQLDAHDDYRVLRKLGVVTRYSTLSAGATERRALVVDVETTGLSFANDVIIELGLMLFTYDSLTGRVLNVLAAESWLDDPGRDIPAEIVKLTGISDSEVRGKRIDVERVRELAAGVAIVIAHNAGFDRQFVDRKLPFLAELHWGCSQHDVPWRERGVGSQKLDYLLYTHGGAFLDTHHRALDDCRATLHVLATAFDDARTPMELLLANCRVQRARISAVRSPYDSKEALRKRGYSWSGDAGSPPKTWCREIPQSDVDAEVQWLRECVYAGVAAEPLVEKVDLRRRYA
jgi:DNA polymerase-3 subunit epsilon